MFNIFAYECLISKVVISTPHSEYLQGVLKSNVQQQVTKSFKRDQSCNGFMLYQMNKLK